MKLLKKIKKKANKNELNEIIKMLTFKLKSNEMNINFLF